jgi:hypothetical protein
MTTRRFRRRKNMPDFEIGAMRRDEFEKVMDMTRHSEVFNEEEINTVLELLEEYDRDSEISGYYFLCCRENG